MNIAYILNTKRGYISTIENNYYYYTAHKDEAMSFNSIEEIKNFKRDDFTDKLKELAPITIETIIKFT